jgi:hypothetical protein
VNRPRQLQTRLIRQHCLCRRQPGRRQSWRRHQCYHNLPAWTPRHRNCLNSVLRLLLRQSACYLNTYVLEKSLMWYMS